MGIVFLVQTEPEPRDFAYGWVSYSCERGECVRCTPRVRSVCPADNLAPACIHECHLAKVGDGVQSPVAADKGASPSGVASLGVVTDAEAAAFLEDRRRVLGY